MSELVTAAAEQQQQPEQRGKGAGAVAGRPECPDFVVGEKAVALAILGLALVRIRDADGRVDGDHLLVDRPLHCHADVGQDVPSLRRAAALDDRADDLGADLGAR